MSLENDLKDKLNPEQYKAVSTIEGPILIIAGAGSGKTRSDETSSRLMLRRSLILPKAFSTTSFILYR